MHGESFCFSNRWQLNHNRIELWGQWRLTPVVWTFAARRVKAAFEGNLEMAQPCCAVVIHSVFKYSPPKDVSPELRHSWSFVVVMEMDPSISVVLWLKRLIGRPWFIYFFVFLSYLLLPMSGTNFHQRETFSCMLIYNHQHWWQPRDPGILLPDCICSFLH